ncbi:ArsR family transcriptional regulator [Paenibacillus pseudetheri]|nr:transcriptional regulator [Paenibacillus sp.]
MKAGEIAEKFEISRPAASHHLKILRDARIVDYKKRG